MIYKRNGLNDSDKIFVTIALWICAVSLFAILLTLPMLPDNVAIFEYQINGVSNELGSKFNNLLLIFMLIIPAIIVLLTASLKKRNRLQNNFMSIVLFSIILSLAFGVLIIYGIVRQFYVNNLVKTLNYHGLVAVLSGFILSMFSCLVPTIVHAHEQTAKDEKTFKYFLKSAATKHWNIGAYGFLIAAIVSAMTPDLYCYIPVAAALIVYVAFLSMIGKKCIDADANAKTDEKANNDTNDQVEDGNV